MNFGRGTGRLAKFFFLWTIIGPTFNFIFNPVNLFITLNEWLQCILYLIFSMSYKVVFGCFVVLCLSSRNFFNPWRKHRGEEYKSLRRLYINIQYPRISWEMGGGGRYAAHPHPFLQHASANIQYLTLFRTANEGPVRIQYTVNVWFPFMNSQKLNCYFQNRSIMFCLPVPTLIYLWEIYTYIFPGSVCLHILFQENMWTDPGNI